MDFGKYSNKLEREQKARTEKAKREAEAKKRQQERVDKIAAQHQAEIKRKQEEAERAAAIQASQDEAERELNGGVLFRARLRPLPFDLGVSKGVVRCKDKIALPSSAGTSLSSQEAERYGLMYMELTTQKGEEVIRTHGAAVEFSAMEGTVGLPPLLARRLGGDDDVQPENVAQTNGTKVEASENGNKNEVTDMDMEENGVRGGGGGGGGGNFGDGGIRETGGSNASLRSLHASSSSSLSKMGGDALNTISVRYVRLKRGTFVRMQPVEAGFQIPGEDEEVRSCLERELMQHTCLTVGDSVWVTKAERMFQLRVLDLRPEPQVSVVDTEMVMEVAPSLEWEEQERQREAMLAQQEKERLEAEELEKMRVAQEMQECEEKARDLARWRKEKEAALPPQPLDDEVDGVVTCIVRMPNGVRLSWRMYSVQKLQILFDVIDAKGEGMLPMSFNLVASYPRRVFSLIEHSGKTMREIGCEGRQETFFVESLSD